MREGCLPIWLWAIFKWAHVMARNFICCATVAFSSLICDVESHPKSFFMCLSVRLRKDKSYEHFKLIWAAETFTAVAECWSDPSVIHGLPRDGSVWIASLSFHWATVVSDWSRWYLHSIGDSILYRTSSSNHLQDYLVLLHHFLTLFRLLHLAHSIGHLIRFHDFLQAFLHQLFL